MSGEYLIERLGHHGDGIAAGPIYVPGALPGERVSGTLTGDRLEAVKILNPSSERVRAPCAHAKSCGGCMLQHASDDLVARFKQDVVKAALSAQGIEAKIAGIETSPPQSRRRAVLSARRTKKGAIVGFHGRASDTIIAVPGCQVLTPAITAAFPMLETLTRIGASRKGDLRITVTESTVGMDIAVSGGKPLDRDLRIALAAVTGFARLSWNGEQIAQGDPPAQKLGTGRVTPPPGAFLQATEHGQEVLVRQVTDGLRSARKIVDLFAGCGTFSLPLATMADVHAVEGEPEMLAALDKGWRGVGGLHRLTTEARDLFRRPLMADELNGFDAAVIDPPRAGTEAQIAQVAQSGLKQVAMVSCNPVTFARDAAVLCRAGFTMGDILVVDQFRWSSHVELVSLFGR